MKPSLAMLRIFLSLALLVSGSAASPQNHARAGELLRVGTTLVYSSGGVETAWTIDSLASDTTLGDRSGCVRMRLRLGPTAPQSTRAFCADSGRLLTWDDRLQQHRAARPLIANGSLAVRSTGSVSVFETGDFAADTISGVPIDVIPTTITTRDSTGRVVRRLRERFSVQLLTATRGVFEVPDPAQQRGWRVERQFDLVRVSGAASRP
jgi:hypothetical protein